jgi:hypothetical protein
MRVVKRAQQQAYARAWSTWRSAVLQQRAASVAVPLVPNVSDIDVHRVQALQAIMLAHQRNRTAMLSRYWRVWTSHTRSYQAHAHNSAAVVLRLLDKLLRVRLLRKRFAAWRSSATQQHRHAVALTRAEDLLTRRQLRIQMRAFVAWAQTVTQQKLATARSASERLEFNLERKLALSSQKHTMRRIWNQWRSCTDASRRMQQLTANSQQVNGTSLTLTMPCQPWIPGLVSTAPNNQLDSPTLLELSGAMFCVCPVSTGSAGGYAVG